MARAGEREGGHARPGQLSRVSLKDARKGAQGLKQDALEGRIEVQGSPAPVPTFAQATAAVVKMRRPTWKNDKHAAQWRNTLATYAFPVIGEMPVDAITTTHMLDVLEPHWMVKHETASLLRQRCETVFDWAVARGHRKDDPAGKHLLKVLPSQRKMKEHHAALPYAEVPAVLRKVGLSTAYLLTKLAFRLAALTAARSGEIRNADWNEIDWETATWTIPAAKMKAEREHRVPLSDQAMEVLRDAWAYSGPEGLIFPAPRSGMAMSA